MPLRGFHRSWRWVLIAWFQKYVAKIFSARNNNHRRPATCPRTLNAFASVGHIDLEYFRTESENVPLMQGLVTPFRQITDYSCPKGFLQYAFGSLGRDHRSRLDKAARLLLGSISGTKK